METSIDNAKETNVNNLILMGDFNDDQFANNSKLASILESRNLVQLITEPTRVCNGSSTCIDVIAVSCPDLVCLAGTIDAKISDHHGIFCNLNEKSPRPKTYKRLIWKYEHGNYNDLNESLSQIDWSEEFQNLDVNEMLTKWSQLFIYNARKYVPTQLVTIRPGEPPWMSNQLRKIMRRRNRLHKRAKQTNVTDHWALYRRARNITVNELKKAKKKHQERLEERIQFCDSNDSKFGGRL